MKRFWEVLKKLLDQGPIRMKEDRIPVSDKGRPDAQYYTEPVAYYQQMYEEFLASSQRRLSARESNYAWRQRVHGMYGLMARGSLALPFTLQLLQHRNPDAREDGATILQHVGAAPGSIDALLAALQTESDDVARTALIEALGKSSSPRALEALEQLVARADIDLDTREAIDRSIKRLRRAVSR